MCVKVNLLSSNLCFSRITCIYIFLDAFSSLCTESSLHLFPCFDLVVNPKQVQSFWAFQMHNKIFRGYEHGTCPSGAHGYFIGP
jgi:hypothetical protein